MMISNNNNLKYELSTAIMLAVSIRLNNFMLRSHKDERNIYGNVDNNQTIERTNRNIRAFSVMVCGHMILAVIRFLFRVTLLSLASPSSPVIKYQCSLYMFDGMCVGVCAYNSGVTSIILIVHELCTTVSSHFFLYIRWHLL